MSLNLLVDGKPLGSLRVVDLRDELKKRGIKAAGTKAHLQELLISSLLSEQESNQKTASNTEKTDSTSGEENSNDSFTNQSLDSEQKVASVSINEEKNTIKLTIRSSPRKSEPQQTVDESDTESSDASESDQSPGTANDSISDIKGDSIVKPEAKSESESHVTPQVVNKVIDPQAVATSLSKVDKPAVIDVTSNATSKNKADTLAEISSKGHEGDKQQISAHKTKVEDAKPIESNKVAAVEVQKKELPKAEKEAPKEELPKSDTAQKIEKSPLKPAREETKEKGQHKIERVSKQEVVQKSEADRHRDHHHRSDSKSEKKQPQKESSKVEKLDKEYHRDSHRDGKESLKVESHKDSLKAEKDSHKIEKESHKNEKHSAKNEESEPIRISRQHSSELKNKTSLRERLLSQSKTNDEQDSAKPSVQKKRRWGSTGNNNETSELKKGISSEKLKQLIKESVKENDIAANKVSKANEDESIATDRVNEQPKAEEATTVAAVKDDKKVDITFNANENNMPHKEMPSEEIREVSPAKNVESTVLFITGLVRPYTIMQLKKLLGVTGDDNKFWIDKIKSKCYIAYNTVEEAVKVRNEIHNLKWPQSSPKILKSEFATLEDIDRCLNPENYEDLPLSKAKAVDKVDISKGKYDVIMTDAKMVIKNDNERNIREWDRNKIARTAERSEEDSHKRVRHTPPPKDRSDNRTSPERPNRKHDGDKELKERNRSESPVKMLEDLFRKTVATPYIYWLPLTDEQIVEKEKLEKDREARIANRREKSRSREDFSKRPAYNAPRPRYPDTRRRSPSPLYGRRRRSISRSPPPPPRRRPRYSRSRSIERNRFSPRRRR